MIRRRTTTGWVYNITRREVAQPPRQRFLDAATQDVWSEAKHAACPRRLGRLCPAAQRCSNAVASRALRPMNRGLHAALLAAPSGPSHSADLLQVGLSRRIADISLAEACNAPSGSKDLDGRPRRILFADRSKLRAEPPTALFPPCFGLLFVRDPARETEE